MQKLEAFKKDLNELDNLNKEMMNNIRINEMEKVNTRCIADEIATLD